MDMYRDAAYTGGIMAERFVTDWARRIREISKKWPEAFETEMIAKTNPFDGPLWQMMSTQPEDDGLPCFLAASQIFIIHGRAAYEAWRVRNHDITHLQLVDCNYYPWPSHQAAGRILLFLDKHLKGKSAIDLEKVGIQVRLGKGDWYWRRENDWPVPGTQYVKWHLQADGTLSTAGETGSSKEFRYSTKVPHGNQKSGVSFLSAPFEADTELVGHFTATLNVSSSLEDADVVVTLWAVDQRGSVVRLGGQGQPEPIAKGFLRASHRKTDPQKSLPERPWHTHTLEDCMHLSANEVVPIEVEILPTATKIRQGWALRLDVGPQEEQPDIPDYKPPQVRLWYGEQHGEGTNSVHVGSGLANFISCPVVPCKEGRMNTIDS